MSGALPWIGSYKKGNCDLLDLEVLFVFRPEILADGNIPNELDIIAASSEIILYLVIITIILLVFYKEKTLNAFNIIIDESMNNTKLQMIIIAFIISFFIE